MKKAVSFAATAVLFAVAALVFPPGAARAAELVMFEAQGCAYCAMWNQEVGVGYPKSDEGRRAPLRRVYASDPEPTDIQLAKPIVYTPTFVLVGDDGKEVGRIDGYAGAEFWWWFLDTLMKKLPEEAVVPVEGPAKGT